MAEFSKPSWELLRPALSKREFRKNQLLSREGQVCNTLFYIDSGYCRSYYEIDGNIKNIDFFFENEIAVDLSSFASGKKSEINIIACEPMTVILFDKEKLASAAKNSLEIEALGRNCVRQFALKQAEFSNLFQLYSAKDRLAYIEDKYPDMIQRISLTQLASFLGVARETLSRIRGRRLTR